MAEDSGVDAVELSGDVCTFIWKLTEQMEGYGLNKTEDLKPE